MEYWVQWVLGTLIGALSIIIGALGAFAFELQKQLSNVTTRTAVLESRPHIDPVEYTRAITQLTAAITQLTAQISDNTRTSTAQHMELKTAQIRMQSELDEIKDLVQNIKPPPRSM